MISISLCMIVKNEESTLHNCLSSVKDIVDEIIIVDTGSTDNTKDIAKKYTDRIFDFEWIDDFSAARNFSFSKSTKDYIFWLDADDILLKEDIQKLINLKKQISKDTDIVMMKYNYSFDENGSVSLSHYRERLVKRVLNPEWKEPVHEYIKIEGNILTTDICITHTSKHSKGDRNLKIYEETLASGRDLSPRGFYYYAKELFNNQKYEKAIIYFNKFLDFNEGWIEDKINACFHLSMCYHTQNDFDHMLDILLKSENYDSPRAEICCQFGLYYMSQSDYPKAITWYKKATQLNPNNTNWGFVSSDYFGYIPNAQLCVCYDKLGNVNEAIKYNEKAADYKPNSSSVLYNREYFNKIKKDTSTYDNLLQAGEKLLTQNNDNDAAIVYKELLKYDQIAPFACFRLGEIENRNKNIEKSKEYHVKAFTLDKYLSKRILNSTHPQYNYEHTPVEEIIVAKCPLCNKESELHSCYNMLTNTDQELTGFNPIRTWRICKHCHHIFAENYPKNLGDALSKSAPFNYIEPKTYLIPQLGNILSNIKNYAKGSKLLDVGVGAGEMVLAAREMLFDVSGLDIRPIYANNLSKILNIPIHGIDIMEFESNELFDIIILGDVLEHVKEPSLMLERCYNLLNENGVLWVSTPNFESAFSYVKKDLDPMWIVCEHLNYFSYTSLKKVLEQLNFEIKDYKISSHYNGSMEITAIKK